MIPLDRFTSPTLMAGLMILLVIAFPAWALEASQVSSPTPSPIASMGQQDIDAGQRLFRIHCARCHGMLGDGGEGPSLKRARLVHVDDDDELFAVISEGIRGTGMPGVFGPNDQELWQIAGYVRSLGRLPVEEMPGNPERSADLYATRGGCNACHIVNGDGKGVGPELTEVGLRRNLEYLRRSLTNPDADYPMRTDRMSGRINAFLTVQVVGPTGEIEGMRVNEDEFSVQIRDLAGSIHSFDKHTLRSFKKAFGHSLMPGYTTVFSADEVDDLASYLMSLKGSR
ncbi:MAG: c-type cytochrome [Proteobacteria bacterium]|nr:c-type cytochrome [Pseudomonadota bacterium]